MQGILCSQRLNKDISELFSSNFNCSSSHLTVLQTGDSVNEPGFITLEVKVFEGPYRGGRFSFFLNIPSNYPFRAVEVWAVQPIWHPNIDIRSGKVAVPIDWSPVLTLHSFALAVQMLMLEPSTDNTLNLEASSMYTSQPSHFEQHTQRSLQGGIFHDIYFPNVLMSFQDLSVASSRSVAMKRSRQDDFDARYEEEDCMETSDHVVSCDVPRVKRVCHYRDIHTNTSTDEEDNDQESNFSDGHNSLAFPPVSSSNNASADSPLFGNSANNQFAMFGLGGAIGVNLFQQQQHHNPFFTSSSNPLHSSPRHANNMLSHQLPPQVSPFMTIEPNNSSVGK